MSTETKRVIAKVQLHIIFREWEYSDISDYGIKEEQVINIQVIDGAVYLFYWAEIA